MDQGGQVPGSEVGELDRKLGVLQDAVSDDLLVPEADVGVTLEHLGVLSNVRATCDFTAGSDVLKVEEATMFVALVSKYKWILVLSFVVAHMKSVIMRGM